MSTENKSKIYALVCEDEPDLREIISCYLEDLVDEVVVACDGVEALEAIEKQEFNVVISDINMPRLSGLELLSQLQEKEIDVPFIICTAFSDKENAVAALRLGAFDFIDKPIDEAAFNSTVSKAINLSIDQDNIEYDLEASVDQYKKRHKQMLSSRLANKHRKKAS